MWIYFWWEETQIVSVFGKCMCPVLDICLCMKACPASCKSCNFHCQSFHCQLGVLAPCHDPLMRKAFIVSTPPCLSLSPPFFRSIFPGEDIQFPRQQSRPKPSVTGSLSNRKIKRLKLLSLSFSFLHILLISHQMEQRIMGVCERWCFRCFSPRQLKGTGFTKG